MVERKGVDDRTFVRRTMIVLALAAVAILLWHLRSLLLMLFGAVVVATVFRALADRIVKLTGWRDGLALALAIGLTLGGLGGLIAPFGQQIGLQLDTLRETLPAAWRSFEERVGTSA